MSLLFGFEASAIAPFSKTLGREEMSLFPDSLACHLGY